MGGLGGRGGRTSRGQVVQYSTVQCSAARRGWSCSPGLLLLLLLLLVLLVVVLLVLLVAAVCRGSSRPGGLVKGSRGAEGGRAGGR